MRLSLAAISTALFTVSSVTAKFANTPEIEIVGNKFYYSNNGSQFLMKGIAYQQNTANSTTGLQYVDPLADESICRRDVEYLKELKTNTLRVYAVDPTVDHDPCMEIFANAGIYIIADLSEPVLSVNRDNPSWTLDLYDRYTSVVDMFAPYSNVLGFFAGNEVTNNASNTDASPFVKAAVRDMKKYIDAQGYRAIPVGYSSNDDEETRVAIADYFACGSLEERADFFGINMYEWCGNSTFETSGFADRTDDFRNLTIPIFFSEYGCNLVRPRLFTEVGTLYSDNMTDVWSGGIVYMFHEEENEYGLVEIINNRVSTLSDFDNYKTQINNISPNLAQSSTATGAATRTLACPGNNAPTWRASTDLPPTPDREYCECVSEQLQCVVNDDVDEEDYGELYGTVCGLVDCGDISVNGTTGEYGQFSFCSDKQKLSFVLNQYYLLLDQDSGACEFLGSATINANARSQTCSAGNPFTATPRSASSSRATSDATETGNRNNAGAGLDANRLSKGQLVGLTTLITLFATGISMALFD